METMITSKYYFKHQAEATVCNIPAVFRKVPTNYERSIFTPLKSCVNRKLRDKQKRNTGTCL